MEDINILEVPDKYYHLNDDGSFANGIIENKKQENINYWASKSRQIGILMLCSMGFLVLVLVVETDIFNFFWQMLWGV